MTVEMTLSLCENKKITQNNKKRKKKKSKISPMSYM